MVEAGADADTAWGEVARGRSVIREQFTAGAQLVLRVLLRFVEAELDGGGHTVLESEAAFKPSVTNGGQASPGSGTLGTVLVGVIRLEREIAFPVGTVLERHAEASATDREIERIVNSTWDVASDAVIAASGAGRIIHLRTGLNTKRWRDA